MYRLPLTLDTPAENLALDEALLEAAEAGELPDDVLRTWESAAPFAVLGRSSPASEVNWDACRSDGVVALRRTSGGQSVVAGPGCLMYAIVLRTETRQELQGVDRIHEYVLERVLDGLRTVSADIVRVGISDLALAMPDRPPKKFSGNSLRVRRHAMLYHGTILYDFPLAKMSRWLGKPRREPEYRAGRGHEQFVTNLSAGRDALERALVGAWDACETLVEWPMSRTAILTQTHFAPLALDP